MACRLRECYPQNTSSWREFQASHFRPTLATVEYDYFLSFLSNMFKRCTCLRDTLYKEAINPNPTNSLTPEIQCYPYFPLSKQHNCHKSFICHLKVFLPSLPRIYGFHRGKCVIVVIVKCVIGYTFTSSPCLLLSMNSGSNLSAAN